MTLSFLRPLVPILFLAVGSILQSCQGTYDMVVENVTLIDGTGAPPQTQANVYVRDGRVAAISTGSRSGRASSVVDGSGRFLIPGLIDAHAHPFPIARTFPQFAHFGVTSILIPGCGDCSNENLARTRELAASGSIPAPRVFHTSQHFTMVGRHPVKTYPGPKWVEGETVYYLRTTDDAERFVAEVARQPIVGIKLTIEDGPAPPFVETIPTEFVEAVVEAAHRHDLRVLAHVSTIEHVRIAETAGADDILHFVGVDIDWDTDLEMIQRLRQRDPSWVTTLMIDKSFLYPANAEWLQAAIATGQYRPSELEELPGAESPRVSPKILAQLYGISDPTLENVMRPQLEDLRQLHGMGFNLVAGTDTGNDYIFAGLSLHEEMELLGMVFSPTEVIPMATSNAARILGAADELGTIEVGKWADMLLLDRDPLQDIRNTRSIVNVFKAGQLLER